MCIELKIPITNSQQIYYSVDYTVSNSMSKERTSGINCLVTDVLTFVVIKAPYIPLRLQHTTVVSRLKETC